MPDGLGIDPSAIVRTAQVLDQLDYVIGIGAAIDRETAMALRQQGCKLICYKGGNGAVIFFAKAFVHGTTEKNYRFPLLLAFPQPRRRPPARTNIEAIGRMCA